MTVHGGAVDDTTAPLSFLCLRFLTPYKYIISDLILTTLFRPIVFLKQNINTLFKLFCGGLKSCSYLYTNRFKPNETIDTSS